MPVEDVLSLFVLKNSKLTLPLVAMRLCCVQNAECGMEINNHDKIRHETEVCEYRRVKCYHCGQIQEDVEILKGGLSELNGIVEDMKNNHVEMKQVVRKFEGRLMEKVEVLKTSQDQIKQDQQYVKQEVKKVKNLKENVLSVKKDLDEVKVMMIQVLEKLNMLEQHNKVSSPTAGILNTARENILVAGLSWLRKTSKSTEIYSWQKNGWFEVLDMNEKHCCATSFIYNYQLFVVGGYFSNTIETLDLNKLQFKTEKISGKTSLCLL